jgi:NADH dehydrogenase
MTSRWEQSSVVTVFGGSGFLGRYAVEALALDGWRVCAAMRRPELAGHLQPLGEVGQIYAVQANVRYPDTVARAMTSAEAVVNLAGILTEQRRQTFEAVNVAGARAIASSAREAGVRSLVHVSAIGANPESSSRYARTKAAGEQAVLCEFPQSVILRPAIAFGPEDRLFNRFAALACFSPVLPLIGGGRIGLQPVYAGDVGAAIAGACSGKARPRTTYELGGPEAITFRQLLDQMLQWLGRHRLYVPMPFWLSKLAALTMLPLPGRLRPFTADDIRLLETDNIVGELAQAEGRTLAGLGVEHPHATASIVPAYLERFHPRGQFAHYRSLPR